LFYHHSYFSAHLAAAIVYFQPRGQVLPAVSSFSTSVAHVCSVVQCLDVLFDDYPRCCHNVVDFSICLLFSLSDFVKINAAHLILPNLHPFYYVPFVVFFFPLPLLCASLFSVPDTLTHPPSSIVDLVFSSAVSCARLITNSGAFGRCTVWDLEELSFPLCSFLA